MSDIYLTIENGVVVNRTVGPDPSATLSVPEPEETPVQVGWVTQDGGFTFGQPDQK